MAIEGQSFLDKETQGIQPSASQNDRKRKKQAATKMKLSNVWDVTQSD